MPAQQYPALDGQESAVIFNNSKQIKKQSPVDRRTKLVARHLL